MRSIRSERVLVEGELRPATVRFEEGVITDIGDGLADADYGGSVILPGLVDSHVHVNEPGRTDWEGFETATSAALAGGTTTIVDMPLNSVPPTVDLEALESKKVAARGQLSCDVGFWGGIIPGSEDDVAELEAAGVCGFKVFMADSGVEEFPPLTGLDRLELTTPLLVHAEDPALLASPADGSYDSYLASRPPEAEASAIRSLYGLSGRVHILHVSSAEGVEAISGGPKTMSGETCPHYLTFTSDDVSGAEFKCAPPIRSEDHREALWEALVSGELSMVVSDHSPSPPSMKQGAFDTAWGGVSSLQLRLVAIWTGCHERGIGIERLGEWLALQPARLAGLDDRKGSIEVGKDADFVVFDPNGRTEVRAHDLLHRHPVTPYDGMRLRGFVVDTLLGSPARMLAR